MVVKHLKAIITIVLVAFVYSCARVPMTGRRQTKLLPESELVSMSLTEYQGFLDTSVVVKTGAQQQMITNVGTRISKAVEDYLRTTKDSSAVGLFKWEFHLVDNPTVNAWCMPGGKVVFYSGIMPICQDENGVAVVMGHEISHAVARHGNERMSQGLIQQLGGIALSVAIADKPAQTQQLFQIAYGVGTQVGIMLPFSRTHESEADHIGLMFMSMAGYDPATAPKFWERMSSMSGGAGVPAFLSTHPSDQKRMQDLQKLQPQAMVYYNQYLEKQKKGN
ncbi:MAG: M48 family metalloprotease [Bacteroidetes bacterium]|nr:M48 family metalloprotease [Bacteroidota bacterium]